MGGVIVRVMGGVVGGFNDGVMVELWVELRLEV